MTARVTPLPSRGSTYFDARDPDRTLRVSWRPEAGVFALSSWKGDECVSTFQLARSEVAGLVSTLVSLLAAEPAAAEVTAAS